MHGIKLSNFCVSNAGKPEKSLQSQEFPITHSGQFYAKLACKIITMIIMGQRLGLLPEDCIRHLFQWLAIQLWRGNACICASRVSTRLPVGDGMIWLLFYCFIQLHNNNSNNTINSYYSNKPFLKLLQATTGYMLTPLLTMVNRWMSLNWTTRGLFPQVRNFSFCAYCSRVNSRMPNHLPVTAGVKPTQHCSVLTLKMM